MKGDFSRDTFDPAKHFSRVLMQQGRVQLDADWNEQTSILLHYLQTLAKDLIGPYGGPKENAGFKIEGATDDMGFYISKGRYYVDGILCENETEGRSYKNQPDYPDPPISMDKDKSYLVYLDVWERHITAGEDDAIREKALGGTDTASRAKVVWQVKVKAIPRSADAVRLTCSTLWEEQVKNWQADNRGKLKARTKPAGEEYTACTIPPESRYRGIENQLYRVEIHTGSIDGTATFKWSRENGSVVTGGKLEGGRLVVGNPHGFTAGSWVEIISNKQELTGLSGTLVKIISVEGDVLRVDGTLPSMNDKNNWKVRRWDMAAGAIQITEGPDEKNWFELEDGIQIQFQVGGHVYRTGDYWLIPARVATGDIEWPKDQAQSPHGVEHHYAPLAILQAEASQWLVQDCRCRFEPKCTSKPMETIDPIKK